MQTYAALSASALSGATLATGFGIEDARTEAIKWGVTSASGNIAALHEIRKSYKEIVDAVEQAVGLRLDTVPLYSSRVAMALGSGVYPLLLVHTNHAARAVREKNYTLVALTSDTRDNRVSFLARKDASIGTLADLKHKCVVSTGSLCTAIARHVLAGADLLDRLDAFRHVRDSEAVPFFLANQYCDVGVTCSAALVDSLERSGATLIHQTEPYPVYALLAASHIDPQMVTMLRDAFVSFRHQPDSTFVRATGIRAFVAPDASTGTLLDMFP
jgi:ABC-type phosphate/phosphonate transport system substrate-binding protein